MAEKEYIERGALLQYAKEYAPAFSAVFEIIALSVPAADVVEVRHGHWIDKPTGRYMHMGSWCSVCGEKSGIGGIESNRHKPYCPNCGAKMDGERKADNE